MKKNKPFKLTFIFMLLITIVLLNACSVPPTESDEPTAATASDAATDSAAQTESSTPSGETSAETIPTEGLVFGFANYSLGNPYCATFAEGALARAEELGIELNVVDNKVDVVNQMNSIDNFITLGVDGILTIAVEPNAIEGVVQEAVDAGIPVISNSTQVNSATLFVSADNYEMGYNCGKAAAEWLKANKDGVGKVAFLNAPFLPTLVDRENGFVAAINELVPESEVVMMAPAGTLEECQASAETIIQAHPDISVICGYNDEAGLGACAAVEASGLTDVFVGGVDAAPEAIAKIKEGGPYKATVDNIPYENGQLLIDLMVRILNGEEMEETYTIPTKIVDANNIDEY